MSNHLLPQKKPSWKAGFLWMILLACALFVSAQVSAFSLSSVSVDNTLKEGLDISESANIYPAVEITSNLNLPLISNKVADLVLTEHTESCGNDCVSSGQMTTYKDMPLFDKINFYTIKEDGSRVLQPIRNYKVQISTEEKEKEVEDYEYVCKDTGKISENKTAIQECSNILVGSHNETEKVWIDYNEGEEVKEGTYFYKVSGEKKAERVVDWVPVIDGKEVDELSVWGFTDTTTTYQSLGISTVDNEQNAIGAYKYSAYRFNSTGNYSVTNVTIYVSSTSSLASPVNAGLYNSNSSGDVGTFIANSTNSISSFSTGQRYTWNFNLGNNTIIKDNAYWIVFWASGSANFIRVGETTGAGGFVFEGSTTDLNTFQRVTSILTANINITGKNYVSGSSITINSPLNNAVFNNSLVNFNVTTNVVDGANATNITLYLNGIANETKIITGATNTTIFTKSLSDGLHNQSYIACDTDGDCGNSSTYYFTIDYTAPTINVISPTFENYLYQNKTLNLNYSITDATSNLSACWYIYNNNNYFNSTQYMDYEIDKNFSVYKSPIEFIYLNETNTFINGSEIPSACLNRDILQFRQTRVIDMFGPDYQEYSCYDAAGTRYRFKNSSLGYSDYTNLTTLRILKAENCSLTNTTTFNYSVGKNSIQVYANDTLNNIANVNQSWGYYLIENSVSYNKNTMEGSLESFYLNTSVSTLDITSAVFNYKNRTQVSQINSNGNYRIIFIEDFEIEAVTSQENATFYWEITLSNGIKFNTTSLKQIIDNVGIDECTSYTYKLINMTLYDEALKTPLNGTIELFYEIQNYPNYNTIQYYNKTYSGVTSKTLCSNVNFSGTSFVQSAEIKYYANDYEKELYYIQKGNMNHIVNLGLYDLKSNDSTNFLITYQNNKMVKVKEAVVQLLRKYISQDLYEVVEAPLTSSEGTAVLHIDLNTNIYKAVVVKDGVILDTFDNLVFSCESPLSTQCTQNLYGNINPSNSISIENLQDFSYSVSSLNDTVTVIFSIPSGMPSTVNLLLKQTDYFGNSTLCNKTVTSSGGSIQCTFLKTIGDSILNLYLYKDGDLISTESYVVPEENGLDFLNNNFFIVFIFILSLVGMAFSSPEWMIINSIITLLVAGSLWLLNGMNFVIGLGAIIWLVIAAAILINKLSQQEDR